VSTLDLLAKIQELAGLLPLEYETKRKTAAKELGMRVGILDAEVGKFRASGSNSFEHSNKEPPSPTETGTSNCSNEQLFEQAQPLIDADDPLELVRKALTVGGYAGDTRPAELVYVAATSRLLSRPLNIHVLALSGAGKNHTVDSALTLHPLEAYYKLSASSPRALVYTDEDFKHRMVVIGEMDSIPSEGPAASTVRSIANDMCMSYETVERDPESGKFVTRKINKDGPTGLITTGTRPFDEQMSTRCLSLTLADDPEQTRAVMRAEAAEAEMEARLEVDVAPFHAYQRWLAEGERRVIIPFACALAALVPSRAVRARRDFKQLLTTIKTLALLSRAKRQRTTSGFIIATIEQDYARARGLLVPLMDSIANEGLTAAIREVVEAVKAGEEIAATELAKRLKLSKSTISWRVRQAIHGGWLANLETRRSYPARLVRGDLLPEQRSALPTADELAMAFEASKNHSNDHSNTNETIEAEGLGEGLFECSNQNPGEEIEVDAEELE